MTKERIEDFRESVLPFMQKRLLEINYENLGELDTEEFTRDFNEILDLATKALEPTAKNNLGVDCISRTRAIERLKLNFPISQGADNSRDRHRYMQALADLQAIKELPPVKPQEPRCRDCKWWKDSDGKYRRGCGAESQCPINTHAVYCGEGYCFMFEPQESRDEK